MLDAPALRRAMHNVALDAVRNVDNTCRVRRYCAAAAGDGSNGEAGGGGVEGKGQQAADDKSPIGNDGDHMISAVAGNGEVVARAVTARGLVQVRKATASVRDTVHPYDKMRLPPLSLSIALR